MTPLRNAGFAAQRKHLQTHLLFAGLGQVAFQNVANLRSGVVIACLGS